MQHPGVDSCASISFHHQPDPGQTWHIQCSSVPKSSESFWISLLPQLYLAKTALRRLDLHGNPRCVKQDGYWHHLDSIWKWWNASLAMQRDRTYPSTFQYHRCPSHFTSCPFTCMVNTEKISSPQAPSSFFSRMAASIWLYLKLSSVCLDDEIYQRPGKKEIISFRKKTRRSHGAEKNGTYSDQCAQTERLISATEKFKPVFYKSLFISVSILYIQMLSQMSLRELSKTPDLNQLPPVAQLSQICQAIRIALKSAWPKSGCARESMKLHPNLSSQSRLVEHDWCALHLGISSRRALNPT